MGRFYGKGMYVTEDAWNPNLFISDLANQGFGYVIIEESPKQRQQTDPSVFQTLRNAGYNPGIWWRENAAGGITPQQSIDYWGTFLFIGDIESSGDRTNFINLIGSPSAFKAANPNVNLGLSVTDPAFQTNNNYDPDLSAPWISAGWMVHPQCYTNQDPNANVSGQLFAYHNQLCWPYDWIFPSLGTWGGYDASVYCAQLAQEPGVQSWNLYYYQGLRGTGTLQTTLQALKSCGTRGLWQSSHFIPSAGQFVTYQADPTYGPTGRLSHSPFQRDCGPNNDHLTPVAIDPLEGNPDGTSGFANVSVGQAYAEKIGGFAMAIPPTALITRVRLSYVARADIASGKQAFVAWFTPDSASHQYLDSVTTSFATYTHDVTGDRAWQLSDFAEPGFYVSVGGKTNSGAVSGIYIDSVQVIVDYTVPQNTPPPDKVDSGKNTMTVTQRNVKQGRRDAAKNAMTVLPRGSGYICNPGPCTPPLVDSGVNTQTVSQTVVKEARADSAKAIVGVSQKGVAFIPGQPTNVPQLWPCPPIGSQTVYSNGGFTNPTNVCLDDGSYATAVPASLGGKGNAYGAFGFDALIPLGATIFSVQFIYQFKVSFAALSGGAFVRAKARIGGVEQANHDSASPNVALQDFTITVDLTADRSWTRADLLDGTFEFVLEARRGGAPQSITVSVDYIEVVVGYVLANAHDSGRNAMTVSQQGVGHQADSGRSSMTVTPVKTKEGVSDAATAPGPGGLTPYHAFVLIQSTPSYQADFGTNQLALAQRSIREARADAAKNTLVLVPLDAHEGRPDTGRNTLAVVQSGIGQVITHPADSGTNVVGLVPVTKKAARRDLGRNVLQLIQNQQLPFWLRPVPFIPAPSLSCGVYEVWAFTRGGTDAVGVLTFDGIEWNRLLNDTGEASVGVPLGTAGASCLTLLQKLRNWEHELAIIRDGELVWTGPLVKKAGSRANERSILTCRDLSAWFDRRRIHNDHVYGGTVDLGVVFQDLADDALAPDPSPNIILQCTETQLLGTYSVLGLDHKLAGPELRSISQMGLDWTQLGRVMLAGGVVVPTDPLATLYDPHFTVPPDVVEDGLSQENYSGVRGPGGGTGNGDDVYGYAQSAESQRLYGLLESVVSDSLSTDSVMAQALAESRQASLANPVVIVEQGALANGAPVSVSELVPGAEVVLKLSETTEPVDAVFRLSTVKGVVSATGAQDETITVGFVPLGTVLTKHHKPPRPVVSAG